MKASSITNMSQNSNKKSSRRILHFQDVSGEHLDLGWTKNLSDLPFEIGNLCSLKTLYLYSSNMMTLPRTIGRLQSLEELDLSWTSNLSELPDEIGDLVSLKKLDFVDSKIVRLPPSIGRLSNLKVLNLSMTKKLRSLPQEICDLASLEELLLSKSSIRKLPEEIGNLQSLKVLDLFATDILTLPDSIARLKNLEHLDLGGTPVSELREVLRTIVSDCRSLGSLGPKVEEKYSDLRYPLACNRARYRTNLGIISNMESAPLSTKLWPCVFQNAKGAFNLYSFSERYYHRAYHTIQEPEAIYQLLSDGRESLIQHLMEAFQNK